jgi:hypothetical protein
VGQDREKLVLPTVGVLGERARVALPREFLF